MRCRPPPRHLTPLEHGPWLTELSSLRALRFVALGASGGVLVALMLGPHALPGSSAWHVLAWLLMYAGMLAVLTLLRLWVQSAWNATHQYCPDCLSYMTRGAQVCPFCGFRAPPAATPGRPLPSRAVSSGSRHPELTRCLVVLKPGGVRRGAGSGQAGSHAVRDA